MLDRLTGLLERGNRIYGHYVFCWNWHPSVLEPTAGDAGTGLFVRSFLLELACWGTTSVRRWIVLATRKMHPAEGNATTGNQKSYDSRTILLEPAGDFC